MDSIRKEIENELKRTRLDKGRLYELLLKIVDNASSQESQGPQGPEGPQGLQGLRGLQGPQGPTCECACVSKASSSDTDTRVKKVVKKKVHPISAE